MAEADLVATLAAAYARRSDVQILVEKCFSKDGVAFKAAKTSCGRRSRKDNLYKLAESRPDGCISAGDVLAWMVAKKVVLKDDLKLACRELGLRVSGSVQDLLAQLLSSGFLGRATGALEWPDPS